MQSLSIIELEHLFDLMNEMYMHACCANWEALARLDQQRRALIGYDSKNSGPDIHNLQEIRADRSSECEQLDSLVEKIQHLDKQIIREARAARAKWMAENRGLSAQVKAKKQYAQTNSIT